MCQRTYIMGIISVVLISTGLTFKIFHILGADVLFALALVLMVTGVAISTMWCPIHRDLAFPAIILFSIYVVFFIRHNEGR